MNVLAVFGTRPEAIKMAAVIREMEKHREQVTLRVCVTAQHRELLDSVLSLFHIRPDYDLNIMRPGQSLEGITEDVLRGLAPVIHAEQPDWVLVQGDTTTAMAAALAAFYQQVPVGHIEAGLRTYNKYRPFPEDVNRRLVGIIADRHFAPTHWAAVNLLKEGIDRTQVLITGNTVIDALYHVASLPFDPFGTALEPLATDHRRLILASAHRRESLGGGMADIFAAFAAIATCHQDVRVVLPVHPNPRVHDLAHHMLSDIPNITLLPPLEYRPFVWLLQRSYFIISDSGGVQEEAPAFGKPALVLRETTERPEGIHAGTARLVGTKPEHVVAVADELLNEPDAYRKMARAVNPYGDGHAAERIVASLISGHDRKIEEFSPSRPRRVTVVTSRKVDEMAVAQTAG